MTTITYLVKLIFEIEMMSMEYSNYKNLPIKERKIRTLIDQVCTQIGFTISHQDCNRIAKMKNMNADEFAKQILLTEGLYHEYEPRFSNELRQKYKEIVENSN